MRTDSAAAEAAPAGLPLASGSLARRVLSRLALRVALVIVLTTAIAYVHVVHKVSDRSLETLNHYIAERGERERAVFALARDNHAVMKQALIARLRAAPATDMEARFDHLFIRFPDGAVRNRLETYDGRHDCFVYIAAATPLDAALRHRVLVFYDLCRQFGPALQNRFENLYLTTPENVLVGYYPASPNYAHGMGPDVDLSAEEWVYIADKAHNPTREMAWTGLLYDPQARKWLVSGETPVDMDGRHVATIGQDISLNDLMDRTIGDAPDGAHNFIVRADGRLIAHPRWMDAIKQMKGGFVIADSGDTYLKRVADLLAGGTATPRIVDNADHGEFLAVAPIAEPGWLFVTVYPKALISGVAADTARLVLVLGGLSLLLEILIFAVVLRNDVTRPLQALVSAAGQVADGRLDVRLAADRDDELGRLAASFNAMAEAVAARAAEQLESEARFRDFAMTASDWFWEMGPDLRFTDFLPPPGAPPILARERYIGKTRWEATGADPDRDQVWRNHRAALEARQPFRDFEFDHVAPDGSRLSVRVSGYPIFDADGEFKGYRGIGRDITAEVAERRVRQKDQERIRHLETALAQRECLNAMGLLVTGLAHELKQPLAAIALYARRLAATAGSWPAAHKGAADALSEIGRLADTSVEIVQQARKIVASPVPAEGTDCCAAAREVMLVTRDEMAEAGITVRLDCEDHPVLAAIDPLGLQLILLNLVRNAREALAGTAAPAIDIAIARTGGGGVRMTVADNGPGIAAGGRDAVFDTFFTTKETGMGLGLAISRHLAEIAGGELTAGDNTPQGTVMCLRLPLFEENPVHA